MSKAQKLILAFVALVILFGLGAGFLLKTQAPGGPGNPIHIVYNDKETFKEGSYAQSMPALPEDARRPKNVVSTYTGNAPVDTRSYIPLSVSSMVTEQLWSLHTAIAEALNTRRITLADFEKLHFGGVAANVDPDYAIFNPRGKIAFKPLLNQWINQSLLDRVTTTKNMPLIFNLRRVTDATGTTTDVLYAIIPGMAPQVCKETKLIYQLTAPFALELDNAKIVQDNAAVMPVLTKAACLITPDRRVYYFAPLAQRVWRKKTGRWTAN